MRTYGIRAFDPVIQSQQLDWLVVSVRECPNQRAERSVVMARFRVAHAPCGPQGAYVQPVRIRRGRHRVLFRQESGTAM